MSEPVAARFDVYHDVDWKDAFQIEEGTRPRDLTGSVLQLVVRPVHDHANLIRELRSDGDAPEIIIDDAELGAAHVEVAQATVATLPLGTWEYFLDEITSGGSRYPILRGQFIVHPGRLPP